MDHVLASRDHFNFRALTELEQDKTVLNGKPRLQVAFGMFSYAADQMTGCALLRPFVDTHVWFRLSPDYLREKLDRILAFLILRLRKR